ncbi:transposase [Mesorhizobium sp. M0701]
MDLRPRPTAKHFTSWLCLAPGDKISGGRVLSSRKRRSSSRAAALLRLAAATIGRSDMALGEHLRHTSGLARRPGGRACPAASCRRTVRISQKRDSRSANFADSSFTRLIPGQLDVSVFGCLVWQLHDRASGQATRRG